MEPLNGDFVQDQVRLLRNEGLQIDLVYADLNIAYLKEGLISNRTKVTSDDKNNKDYILTSSFWPKNNSIGLRKWVDRYSFWVAFYISQEGTPDVIHAHTYLGAMVAEKVSEQNNIPYIVTEHFTGWLDGSIRPLHKRLGTKALRGAKKVLAVSKQLANQLENQTSRDIDTIPNFIDTELFKPSIRKSEGYKKIIYVGDLIGRKQVDLIIRALVILDKQYSLTIIGEGPLQKSLKTLVATEGLKNRVVFTGCLLKEEVALQLQSHDILVHPSKLESFGLSVIEALCCGLSVVAFENLGIEMMKNLSGLYICEKQTAKSIASAINGVVSKKRVNAKTQISKETAAQFGPVVYKNKIKKIYRSAID